MWKCGRPVEGLTKDIIKKDDHRIRISAISREVGISEANLFKIPNKYLGISKVSYRWISRLLSLEQKLCRQVFEKNLTALF